MSAVKSVSSINISSAHFEPFAILKLMTFCILTNFRFFSSATTFGFGCVRFFCMTRSSSCVVSFIDSVWKH